MNEEEVEDTLPTKYIVESSLGGWSRRILGIPPSRLTFSRADVAVFNKLVLTSLKFTPVVLAKHMPYKVNAHGRL
jgi:hypothetical protein